MEKVTGGHSGNEDLSGQQEGSRTDQATERGAGSVVTVHAVS